MGSSFEIRFQFDRLTSDVTNQDEDWQLLLKITADFAIVLKDRTFYGEPDFPVVEFATQASQWLKSSDGDFDYTSMESEEDPLISFRMTPGGLWAPYSPHQLLTPKEVTRISLESALRAFIEDVRAAVLRKFEIDVDRML